MMNRFKNFWAQVTPETKVKLLIACVELVAGAFGLWAAYL